MTKTLDKYRLFGIILEMKSFDNLAKLATESIKKDYSKLTLEQAIELLLAKDQLLNASLDLNKYLIELNRLKSKYIFAKKSETLNGQISLFDDIEASKEEQEVQEKIDNISNNSSKTNTTKRKYEKKLISDNANIPTKEIHIKLDDSNLKDINSDVITTKLVYVPAEFYLAKYHIHTYRKTNEDGTTELVRPSLKSSVFGNSQVSESLINHIINEKIINATPLYRQEKSLAQNKINLSRQDMSNYIYKIAEVLKPIRNLISDYINQSEINHVDETTLNVIELNGKKIKYNNIEYEECETKSKSYVWMASTGNSYHKAIIYELGPTREYEVLNRIFKDNTHQRYIMASGYGAYKTNDNMIHVSCYAHVRRKFFVLIKDLKEEAAKKTEAYKIVMAFNKIYHENNQITQQYQEDYEKIKIEREKIVKPLVLDLIKYIENLANKVSYQSGLGQAIKYFINSKEGMLNFFKDGRLDIDNNYAERQGIKPFVIGRKNWLFANTKKGGEITCLLYSIAQTAIENNLNFEAYLNYLTNHLPYIEDKNFDYSKFLPWSDSLPDEIKIKK